MQHAVQKKKNRIRNRSRNKCNRSNEKVATPGESNSRRDDSPNSTGTEAYNSDAIKLIQQLLREKLLKKGKTVPSKEPNPEHPLTVSKNHKVLKCIGNEQSNDCEAPRPTFLTKLFDQTPVSDTELSDNETEYVEYIYKARQYFMVSLCNLCKTDLRPLQAIPCTSCGLCYYCSHAHMQKDQAHRHMCCALRLVVEHNGHAIFYRCGDFSADQFRSYRIVCTRQVEQAMNRSLTATEQEVLLFPRICTDPKCREHVFERLDTCQHCGEVAFCKDNTNHLSRTHAHWCAVYRLFKALVILQSKFGRLEPSLPSKILKDLPMSSCNTKQIIKKLNLNMTDECEYATLTQMTTGPLTAWYALKMCDRLRGCDHLTVHLIGAEIEFEIDVLQKWELFLLHIIPTVRTLNIVFVGPELNLSNISIEQLKKIKCCRFCLKAQRTIRYFFENNLYHDYCKHPLFSCPDLVCFFNAGLYRATGFGLEDTWPDSIHAVSNLQCPIVVTSYTKYEAPLDLARLFNDSSRRLNIVLPPTINPFASEKPERNFISDDDAPFMFKNFYCFIVE